MYHVSIKTDSGSEPVTQAEIVNFIKYDESDTTEINLINSLVKSARELLEQYLNVSLKSKTYIMEFDSKAVDEYMINLPFGPVVSVTSLTKYENDGTSEALTSGTDFYLRGLQDKTLYFPEINSDYYYALEYVAGYSGTSVQTLPDVLKNAIMELTKFWYDREEPDRFIPEVIKAKVQAYSKQYIL